jgi:hypothetical protein
MHTSESALLGMERSGHQRLAGGEDGGGASDVSVGTSRGGGGGVCGGGVRVRARARVCVCGGGLICHKHMCCFATLNEMKCAIVPMSKGLNRHMLGV